MAAFISTIFTTTEALDWEAGDYLRFDKFRDQVGQNIEYLNASLAAVVTTSYWAIRELEIQAGLLSGAPFA